MFVVVIGHPTHTAFAYAFENTHQRQADIGCNRWNITQIHNADFLSRITRKQNSGGSDSGTYKYTCKGLTCLDLFFGAEIGFIVFCTHKFFYFFIRKHSTI